MFYYDISSKHGVSLSLMYVLSFPSTSVSTLHCVPVVYGLKTHVFQLDMILNICNLNNYYHCWNDLPPEMFCKQLGL